MTSPNKTLLILFLLAAIIGCDKNPTETEPELYYDGSRVTYSPHHWPHNGDPYSGNYCMVYSDVATDDMKRQVGEFADHTFTGIMQLFNFDQPTDFRYPPGNEKIDVYINQIQEEQIFAAFWGSVLMSIRATTLDTIRLDYLFKHELTHAFEYLIEGTVLLGTDVWFREGIAIYVGGGMNYIRNSDNFGVGLIQFENEIFNRLSTYFGVGLETVKHF